MNLREIAERIASDDAGTAENNYASWQSIHWCGTYGCCGSGKEINRDVLADLIEAALRKATSQGPQQGSVCAPTCRREITRQADDSAAYLSEPCTCGARRQPDTLGLSLDMLDADWLRELAARLEIKAVLARPDLVSIGRLRLLAANIETAVRDIGVLRQQVQKGQK